MDEQDRDIVERLTATALHNYNLTNNEVLTLADIINRLDKQLTEIKEAGEFIEIYVKYLNQLEEIGDFCDIILNPGGHDITILAKHFRRLAKALKEVSDETFK